MAKLYCNLDKSVLIKIVLLISIIFLIAYILNYASSNKLVEALTKPSSSSSGIAGEWTQLGSPVDSCQPPQSDCIVTFTDAGPCPVGSGCPVGLPQVVGQGTKNLWPGRTGNGYVNGNTLSFMFNNNVNMTATISDNKLTWQNGVVWTKVSPKPVPLPAAPVLKSTPLATQCSCHGPNFVATDSGCGSVAKPCCREPNKANPQPLCKDGPCGCHGPHFVTANDGCGSIGAPCCREPNKRDPKPFCTIKGANPLIDFVNADPNIYSTPITSSSAAKAGTLGTYFVSGTPAPTSSNSPPSSWISHDGNCKATVINTYPTMQAALDSCECDDTCDALYKGKSGDWSTRKSCCNVKPRPSWCTDDNKCTTGISCNTQQGGTTYIKPGTSNPAKPVPAPVPSGKCIPNVPALAIVGNPILYGIAGNGCKNYTTKETCGPIGTMCPACCVWQGS